MKTSRYFDEQFSKKRRNPDIESIRQVLAASLRHDPRADRTACRVAK